MTKLQRAITGFIIGTIGVIILVLFIEYGWFIAIGVFFMIWGNNMGQALDEEDHRDS